jgi:proton-dependent oligopeptide transporter, POT family
MSPAGPTPTRIASPTFLGHPRGLFFLAFTECWERFSYYGMTALVVLYMVDELLLPAHVGRVAGLAPLRAALEGLSGPLSSQALASQIFGLYTGFVYFTPLLGGLIADRWTGQHNAVVIGALAMSAGHIAMTFDRSFLLALVLLVVGSGFLKGNIAAQVGALYPGAEELRRARGYVIFSTGINVGAIAGPLVCGLLAQVYGWHYGFGVAALLMLLGLATYLCGYRHLPGRVARTAARGPALTAAGRRAVAALIAAMIITILPSIAYLQLYDVMPVWIQQQVAPEVAGFRIPIPWYEAVNPLSSVLGVPLLFWIWRAQARRGAEPSDLAKIATGSWLTAASNLILVAAVLAAGPAPVHPLWPLLYSAALGIAFVYYWPTLLALVSRAAPPAVNATLMGIAYMSLFVSNNLIGWIGGFYERLGPAAFWALHAAIGAAGALAVIAFGGPLGRVLEPPSPSPAPPA